MKKDSLLFSSTNNMPNINMYQQKVKELKRLQCEYVISIDQVCMKMMFRVQIGDDTSRFSLASLALSTYIYSLVS